ncbi:hypothetical protein Btru_044990 [Bulinus truncatus]|nr:hypothetical protein Btru_044990 [Bulinus truncatus]
MSVRAAAKEPPRRTSATGLLARTDYTNLKCCCLDSDFIYQRYIKEDRYFAAETCHISQRSEEHSRFIDAIPVSLDSGEHKVYSRCYEQRPPTPTGKKSVAGQADKSPDKGPRVIFLCLKTSVTDEGTLMENLMEDELFPDEDLLSDLADDQMTVSSGSSDGRPYHRPKKSVAGQADKSAAVRRMEQYSANARTPAIKIQFKPSTVI